MLFICFDGEDSSDFTYVAKAIFSQREPKGTVNFQLVFGFSSDCLFQNQKGIVEII